MDIKIFEKAKELLLLKEELEAEIRHWDGDFPRPQCFYSSRDIRLGTNLPMDFITSVQRNAVCILKVRLSEVDKELEAL